MNVGIGLSVSNFSSVPTVGLDLDAAIAALFSSGEEGAWYDPSDSSTVWQDAAGTTPAGVGDPVGRIDDKSGNGNHATQSTSTARPTLQVTGTTPATLGSELVTNGTFDSDLASWTTGSGTATWVSGAAQLTGAIGATGRIYQTRTFTANTWYKLSADCVSATGTTAVLEIIGQTSQTVSSGQTATLYWRAPSSGSFYVQVRTDNTGAVSATWDNISVKEVLTWADPKYYLDFDGADDCLQTPAIDFSITDKMSVFAGITKETDSVAAIICELTAISINPGAFSLFAGNPVANRRFVWSVAATQTLIGTNSYPAPATVVNSLLIDRAGTDAASTLFPRINGSTPSLDDAVDNNVPGNFSNSNLNIGARDNGASNRLNGRIYGLIVRGVLSTAAEIEATESYLATKSGVTLP